MSERPTIAGLLGWLRADALATLLGFGCALAITISWSLHHSIPWACFHGFFSWFYVAFYALQQ